MALDTATKRAASLHYARPYTAGIVPPIGTSSNVRRGNSLGLYFGADAPSSASDVYMSITFCSSTTETTEADLVVTTTEAVLVVTEAGIRCDANSGTGIGYMIIGSTFVVA